MIIFDETILIQNAERDSDLFETYSAFNLLLPLNFDNPIKVESMNCEILKHYKTGKKFKLTLSVEE